MFNCKYIENFILLYENVGDYQSQENQKSMEGKVIIFYYKAHPCVEFL